MQVTQQILNVTSGAYHHTVSNRTYQVPLKELMADNYDSSSYAGRVIHFMEVTSFANFFVTKEKLAESVKLVNKY